MQKTILLALLALGTLLIACGSEDKNRAGHEASPQKESAKTDGLLYTDGILLEVVAWGPRATQKGQLFNRQPDGASAFWIESPDKEHGIEYELWLDDLLLHTNNPADSPLVSGGLTEEQARKIVANPGIRTLSLIEPSRKLRQIVGEFLIE